MKFLTTLFLVFSLLAVPEFSSAQPTNLQAKQKVKISSTTVAQPAGTRIMDAKLSKVYRPTLVLKPGVLKPVPGRVATPAETTQPNEPEEEDPDAYLELEREGPGNFPFDLENNFQTDVGRVKSDVLSLFGTVLRDGNAKSGYYYYFPKEYHLGWSERNGEYDFNVTYGQATDGGPGRTTVTAVLRPKLRDQDVGIARELLLTDLRGKSEAQFGVQELMAIPMARPPEINFTNLTQFGVETTDISMRAPSNLGEPILLSFTTDQIDALMAMFFNNIGLFGDVILYPQGMDGSISIPFNLKIDAPETYGQLELTGTDWRKEWRNPTDYPIQIGHLHALRRERNGTYRVYSWRAGETEVPPGAKVNFSTSTVPAWLDTDGKVKRMWLDFTINDCNDCDKVVKRKILGSINPDGVAKPEKLEFTILTPLAFTEASLIRIKLRSTQATAAGGERTEMESVTVNEDGTIMDGGTLYVRDGQVDFEYKMVVYLEDGTTFESGWIPSNSKEVVIGSRQIKDNIAEFNE